MAEAGELFGEPFLPMVEEGNSERDPGDALMEAIDAMSADNNPLPEEPHEQPKQEDESPEVSVESPTTGGGFVFKCVFCDQILTSNDDPKLLECLHNTCSACINNKIFEQYEGTNKPELQCPICTFPCDTTKVIDNQFLLDAPPSSGEDAASKAAADLKCSSCSDDAAASSYCVDCNEFICENCVSAHQRLKITKDHTIKPKEDGLADQGATANGGQPSIYCAAHPGEKLTLFCENCDKLTCRDCQLQEHQAHKWKYAHEVAVATRAEIADMLKEVDYKRVLLASAMKVIDDRQELICEKKAALVSEITGLVVKLTHTINVRGKQLVTKLNEVCDSKQKILNDKKSALEQLSRMTDHCIDFTQHILDKGSDLAILYSKKQFMDHLRIVKCKRADIPNPEIPVRIHLALDKVPDLIKVMSTIGQIVVDGRVYPSQPPSPGPANGAVMSPQLPPPPQGGAPSPGAAAPPPVAVRPPAQTPSPHNTPAPPPPPQCFAQQQQQQQQQQRMASPFGGGYPPQGAPPQYGVMGHGPAPPNMNVQQMMAAGGRYPLNNMQQSMLMNNPNRPQRAMMPRLAQQYNQQHQVSSSTHPHGMLQEGANLRHLLQPNAGYMRTAADQFQQNHLVNAQQQQQQYPQQRYQNSGGNVVIQGQQQYRPPQVSPTLARGMILNNTRMPVQPQQQQGVRAPYNQMSAQLKWHTPQQQQQQQQQLYAANRGGAPPYNDNFRITLRQPNAAAADGNRAAAAVPPAAVTSTNPKTPSPNHHKGRSDTEMMTLDKFCEDSVNDLMATIAKLDSNGVQVVAEGRQKGGSPHVDSSTGDSASTSALVAATKAKLDSAIMESGKEDPNEDWCAVCMDGGELVCCDKCPKVFHQYCHIPNLSVEENDTWQCLLCTNFSEVVFNSDKREGELSLRDRKVAERIILEMYCQYDLSLPFRDLIAPDNVEYHELIKEPVALETVRRRLNWSSDDHYRSLEAVMRDVRKMFRNAYTFNAPDSQVYRDGKALEKFFDEQLEKLKPEFAYEMFGDEEEDDDELMVPPNRKYRRIISE